jgi:hypothetical protein
VSACTIVYSGGATRFAKHGGRLGFHAPWPDVGGRKYLAHAKSIGLDAAFAARVVATPSDDMWYPTDDELIAAGIVQRLTDGRDFAISGRGPTPSLVELRELLRKARLFRVLDDKHPEIFSKFLYMSHNAHKLGRSENELRGHSGPLLEQYMRAQLPRASDAALLGLGRATVRHFLEQTKQPGAACVTRARPDAPLVGVNAAPSTDLANEMSEALADLFDTLSDENRLDVPPEVFEPLRLEAVENARRLVGADLDALQNPSGDAAAACRALWALYDSVLRLPGDGPARVLRVLLSEDVEP